MSPFNWLVAPALYTAGCSDAEIARQLGCSTERVRQWRIKHNLPTKITREIHDWEKAAFLYDEGLSDFQISRRLNCDEDSVLVWRRRTGRPGGCLQASHGVPMGQRAKLIRDYLSRNPNAETLEIATACGCSRAYIRAFRQREAKKLQAA